MLCAWPYSKHHHAEGVVLLQVPTSSSWCMPIISQSNFVMVFLLVMPHQGWQHLDHLDEITLQGNLLTEVPHTMAELKVQTATHNLFALLTAAGLSSVHLPACLPPLLLLILPAPLL